MNVEELRLYCLSKKAVTESLPFGPDTLVFKVMDKVFALTGLDSENPAVNLKCDPERAVELREEYQGIVPGYHMNKVHWNTVYMESDVPQKLLEALIDHSYDLIVKGLPVKKREALKNME